MTPQDTPRTQFEQRMRLRRAATCVSSARVAIEAGRLIEAQERLEEACRLDPDGLEARILLEQLKSIEPEDAFEPILPYEEQLPQGARRWSHWAAVVIAVVALAALALWRAPASDETRATPVRQPERTRPHVEAPAAVEAEPAGFPEASPMPSQEAASAEGGAMASSPSPDQLLARAEPPPAGVSAGERGARGTTGEAEARATGARPTDRGSRPAAPTPAASKPPSAEPSTSASSSSRPVETRPASRPAETQPAPGPIRTLPSLAEGLPAVSAPAPAEADLARRGSVEPPRPAAPPPAAAADAAPASLRDPAADEEAIGDVLGQYAEAYNRLDARAARQVWPSVDERALARAFAGLESQGVTFERCELQVDGGEASALCRGRARYVPKVGNRDPISESRQWTFRLRRVGAGWQILKAEAR